MMAATYIVFGIVSLPALLVTGLVLFQGVAAIIPQRRRSGKGSNFPSELVPTLPNGCQSRCPLIRHRRPSLSWTRQTSLQHTTLGT